MKFLERSTMIGDYLLRTSFIFIFPIKKLTLGLYNIIMYSSIIRNVVCVSFFLLFFLRRRERREREFKVFFLKFVSTCTDTFL